MRRELLIVLVAAALALAAAAVVHGAAKKTHPALQLMGSAPLVVRGTGFVPHERVRVVVSARVRKTRRVVAGAAGRFSVRFARFHPSDCFGLTINAFGSNGSRARLKVPRGACMPP